jgi:UDPglucose 6-dehydrogenase
MPNARRVAPQLTYADTLEESVVGVHAIALLTEWTQFRECDPAAIADTVAARVVVDGRNVLDAQRWVGAGFAYLPLGRPVQRPED